MSAGDQPLRRCGGCGENAAYCNHFTVHSVSGIPTGTTYDLRCSACGRMFSINSPWRTIYELIIGVLLAAIGWSSAPAKIENASARHFKFVSGQDWFLLVATSLMALVGSAMVFGAIVRSWRRIENPVATSRR
jgi:hypothetical protein